MAGRRKTTWFAVLILLPGSLALGVQRWMHEPPVAPQLPPTPIDLPATEDMVQLPGGTFFMGSPNSSAAAGSRVDSQPRHQVRLPPYWLDARPVTNRQFEQFVERTDYETEAERRGWSLVFDRKLATWREVVGVHWRHPESPDSSLVGRENFPVVHVTWQDAASYAAWANKRLPTEAEFEYAARGGLSDCQYPWGREQRLSEDYLANGWQGHFPEQDLGLDGFLGTSPVAHFPPNRFGLYDMAGNVWQWCADWYSPEYYAASLTDQPLGPSTGSERVRRGGSWLSAVNYGGDLRLDYRDHAPPTESTNHTGFRCARDVTSGNTSR